MVECWFMTATCCSAHPFSLPDYCACRRDERLRMRSELLAQQARRPSLDGTLARGTRWTRSPPDMAS